MLVGDVVQGIRESVTDLPQVLAPPSIAATPVNSGGNFGPATYSLVMTLFTPWGETAPSNEQLPVLVGVGNVNSISVAWSTQALGGIPSVVSKVRIYLGGPTAGSESLYLDFLPPLVNPIVVTSLTGAQQQVPTTRNTAYLPDSDGDAISAGIMFRWLNDALKLASQVCGGLLDYGGLGTVNGVPQYIAPGEWKRISSLWYDGYPLGMDDSGNYFRRNSITASILASVATSLLTDRMMLEVWPQPARTSAQTTLASQLLATDTQAVLTSAAGFLLTNGFVQIGSEIMSYSQIVGNTLKNLVRGLSGTVAALVAGGGAVTEMNIFWQGWRRYAPAFQPGDSLKTIPVPVGWETQLFKYGLGRAKLAQQGVGDYAKLEQDFIKSLRELFPASDVSTGPRQLGEPTYGLETFGGGPGGGWVIP